MGSLDWLAFTRLLNYVLERHRDLTVSFLIGLMVASLYGLWPFRSYEMVGEERIDIAHILPQANMNLVITVFSISNRLRGGSAVLSSGKSKKLMLTWQQWLNKAQASITAGQNSLEAGDLATAVSRAYFAAFQAVTGALIKRGYQPNRSYAVDIK